MFLNLNLGILSLFFLTLFIKNQCYCSSDDFQSNVDGFVDAFDDAYSTEESSPTTDQTIVGNDIALESSILEENKKQNEGEPVEEEPVVPERVFEPGSDIKHELTEELRSLAERTLASISTELKLVKLTQATSTVTDKVERSLWVEVSRQPCEEASCQVSCRVDLISRDSGDEVTWHNCLDSASSNEVLRDKRGAIGGFKDVDEAEAMELAEIAAQTLDSIDADDTKRVVTQVIRAQKQLVNGIMYHLTLEVASSDCKENEDKCEGKLTDHNICKILMQRLFSGEAPHNAQVIKSECTPISKAKDLDNRKRARRHVNWDAVESNMITDQVPKNKSYSRNATTGEKMFQDPESEKIKELSEFAVAEMDKTTNSPFKQKIIQIYDARSQVVAGMKYYLNMIMVETYCRKGSDEENCRTNLQGFKSCEVVVWEKPWEKFRAITKVNCTPIQRRPKRGILGGKTPVDPNDETVQEMAKFAVSQLDSQSNSLNSQKLVVVKEAESQVVAGANYYLKLQLVETNCRKGSQENRECVASPDKVAQECNVVVYDRPWDKHREMTSAHCSPVPAAKIRTIRSVPGGHKAADPNSPKVQEMAKFAVAQLEARSNSGNSQKLILVKKAETQVVAGANYFLKLQMVETKCPKGSPADKECDAAPDKVIQECDVVVYERPWENHREMTSANCSPAPSSTNRKRSVPGGHKAADPNSPMVQEMAKFAVAQLEARSNSGNSQKLILVKKAETQVVAGTNYFLKLQMVETNCPKGSPADKECDAAPNKVILECDVVVYDRPWEKYREMTSADCSRAPSASTNRKRNVMTGGLSPAEKDSDEIREVANFAVEDLNKKSNSMFKQTLVEVLSAQTQVVAGLKYHLKLRVAETECKKNNVVASEVCVPKENVAHTICDVTVWSRPWLNQRQMTSSSCESAPAKRSLRTGEPESVGTEAPEVLEAAKFSLETIDKSSNSMYKHALIKVVDARVQTVSGRKYFLTMLIGESECTKNQDDKNCAVKTDNSLNDRCNVVVWDRPWLGKKEVLEVKCGLRTKRSVTSEENNMNSIHHAMFEDFKTKYNKVYADEAEHKKRFRIFRANLKKIKAYQENELGTATYGPNMFADLSAKEFKQQYLGLKSSAPPKPSLHHMRRAAIPDISLPLEYDWRDHNAVTPVKNQGQCGSCWAFSVTGNVEGQFAKKHGKLLSFSEQELVDCDKSDSGCNGGYMTVAYESIEKLGGLETEDEYPYDAEDETCKFNETEAAVKVVGSLNITSNETQMAQWLVANGPISIGINANAMQFYMGGVSHPFKFLCNKNELDHGVLIVGYGIHRTSIRHKLMPFWTVKNSWGPHWGEKGYYRVYRGDGTCGVNQMASSAIVE